MVAFALALTMAVSMAGCSGSASASANKTPSPTAIMTEAPKPSPEATPAIAPEVPSAESLQISVESLSDSETIAKTIVERLNGAISISEVPAAYKLYKDSGKTLDAWSIEYAKPYTEAYLKAIFGDQYKTNPFVSDFANKMSVSIKDYLGMYVLTYGRHQPGDIFYMKSDTTSQLYKHSLVYKKTELLDKSTYLITMRETDNFMDTYFKNTTSARPSFDGDTIIKVNISSSDSTNSNKKIVAVTGIQLVSNEQTKSQ